MIQTKQNFCQYPNNEERKIKAAFFKNTVGSDQAHLRKVEAHVVTGDDGHEGHRHGRSHLIDHTAGVAPGVLCHRVPDFEAAIARDMDIGHWHSREEDRGDSLLAPEYGGAGPSGGQAAQLQLLTRPDLGKKIWWGAFSLQSCYPIFDKSCCFNKHDLG